jgi:hypothetical protein
VNDAWRFISASLNVFTAWRLGLGTALSFPHVHNEKLQKLHITIAIEGFAEVCRHIRVLVKIGQQ